MFLNFLQCNFIPLLKNSLFYLGKCLRAIVALRYLYGVSHLDRQQHRPASTALRYPSLHRHGVACFITIHLHLFIYSGYSLRFPRGSSAFDTRRSAAPIAVHLCAENSLYHIGPVRFILPERVVAFHQPSVGTRRFALAAATRLHRVNLYPLRTISPYTTTPIDVWPTPEPYPP